MDERPPDDDVLIQVYRLPKQLIAGFAFKGVPIVFTNVDWFRAPTSFTRAELEKFLRGKRYVEPDGDYLVLSDAPEFTFRFKG